MRKHRLFPLLCFLNVPAPARSVCLPTKSNAGKVINAIDTSTLSIKHLNRDDSCGYGQGACADGYHCLKVWPVEVAQSYMCGKPDLSGFDPTNIPSEYSLPTNNSIWACSIDSICYPTCGYLSAFFDPGDRNCANPGNNAMWECKNDNGSIAMSSAAGNSGVSCKMVCQPGYGMDADGNCIDILTDSANCGQVGYDCSFGYSGYYAATPACPIGQCVDLCPAGSTSMSNLCFNYLTDTYNCGSFGNQCNVANQEVCKSGACVQCYGCYGSI